MFGSGSVRSHLRPRLRPRQVIGITRDMRYSDGGLNVAPTPGGSPEMANVTGGGDWPGHRSHLLFHADQLGRVQQATRDYCRAAWSKLRFVTKDRGLRF